MLVENWAKLVEPKGCDQQYNIILAIKYWQHPSSIPGPKLFNSFVNNLDNSTEYTHSMYVHNTINGNNCYIGRQNCYSEESWQTEEMV